MTTPKRVESDADAYQLLEALRWPDGKPDSCPHCQSPTRFYFRSSQGGSRAYITRSGTPSQQRLWKCGACRRTFSVLVGTALQGTHVNIQLWVAVLAALIEADDNGLSRADIAEKFSIAPDRVTNMMRRLGASDPAEGPFASLLATAAAKYRLNAATFEPGHEPYGSRWQAEASELRARPHVWTLLAERPSVTSARNLSYGIQTGRLLAFRGGGFEARVKGQAVWARYVGQPNPAPSAAPEKA